MRDPTRMQALARLQNVVERRIGKVDLHDARNQVERQMRCLHAHRLAVRHGKGGIDWRKTFQVARIGGVTSYFIEQNMQLTKEGIAFLKILDV
jgi:hypothetical protein